MARLSLISRLGVSAGLAAIMMLAYYLWREHPANRVYTIGFESNPPLQILGPGGEPAGVSVELVREAARRRGIRLRWVLDPRSSEDSLTNRRVELWPLMTITDQRRKKGIYFTAPYVEYDFAFLVREDSPYYFSDDLKNARVTSSDVVLISEMLRERYPQIIHEHSASRAEATRRMCRGEFDAVFGELFNLYSPFLTNSDLCPQTSVRVLPVLNFHTQLGVAAIPEAGAAADAIRSGISEMIADGTAQKISARWNRTTSQEMMSLGEEELERKRLVWYRIWVVFMSLLLLFAVWAEVSFRRARNRAEAAGRALRKAERDLIDLQRMESIGRLAAGIAHDFNNLLTVIKGFGHILQRTLKNPEQKEQVTQIVSATDRAAELTSQLLAFSRRQVVQPRVLDLNALVSDTGRMIGRMIGEDIQFTTILQSGLHRIRCDPGQVSQVLLNLAANARDAIAGSGTLVVETQNVKPGDASYFAPPGAAPANYVLLTVTDSGCGMNEETKRHIFEPFFTTKPADRGCGLGLASVFGIVQLAGGHISVDSSPGHGTSFQLYFPEYCGEEVAAEAPPLPSGLPLGSETIMVVEDRPELRLLIREVMQPLGYRVMEADSGKGALEQIEKCPEQIHLLLTDLIMPGMSGQELVEQLASQYPGIRLLCMSGYTTDLVADHGILRPGIHFIAKPFSPASLAQKVRQVIDSSAARNGPSSIKWLQSG